MFFLICTKCFIKIKKCFYKDDISFYTYSLIRDNDNIIENNLLEKINHKNI